METTTRRQPTGTYWHFLQANRLLRYSDGREVILGQTLKAEGQIELCENGLHASKQAINALYYAPGCTVCLVTLGGEVIHCEDKSVAEERTALWIYDATRLLREFACNIAENALLTERAAGREPDPRSFATIEVTRRYIKGEVSKEDYQAAARISWDVSDEFILSERQAKGSAWRTPEANAGYAASVAAGYTTMSDAADAASGAAYAIREGSKTPAKTKQKLNKMLTNMLLAEYEKENTK